MLFWLCGSICTMAGILVYIEFGLTTPRYLFGRKKISVPRNGGELHYFRIPFKPDLQKGHLSSPTHS